MLAATFELRLVLSAAQVALLARGAVDVTLAPVGDADTKECFKPTVADRSPTPLDEAYRRILDDLEAYRKAVDGGRTIAAN